MYVSLAGRVDGRDCAVIYCRNLETARSIVSCDVVMAVTVCRVCCAAAASFYDEQELRGTPA